MIDYRVSSRPRPIALYSIYAIPLGVFLLFILVFFFMRGSRDSIFTQSPLLDHIAPAIAAAPIADLPPIAQDALSQDGVKIVNFWASWCVPCRIEHPALMQLQARGVAIYGALYADKPERARRYLEELGSPYAGVGDDIGRKSALEWGVRGVPESFVIGRDGKVILRFPGPITPEILEKRINPALQAAGHNEKIQDLPK